MTVPNEQVVNKYLSNETERSIVNRYRELTISLFNESQVLLDQSKNAKEIASSHYYFDALTTKQKKSLFEKQEEFI